MSTKWWVIVTSTDTDRIATAPDVYDLDTPEEAFATAAANESRWDGTDVRVFYGERMPEDDPRWDAAREVRRAEEAERERKAAEHRKATDERNERAEYERLRAKFGEKP